MLCSTARLHSTTPTVNIPEVPKLGAPCYMDKMVSNGVLYKGVPLYEAASLGMLALFQDQVKLLSFHHHIATSLVTSM